jgi:hypothetical protein
MQKKPLYINNMIKRISILAFCIAISSAVLGQKQKVNAAWRALTDYQSTVKEKPDFSYLTKAKESIDAAAVSAETKDNAKMHVYRSQIYYEIFKYNLKAESDKAAQTLKDKNQVREMAYSLVSTKEFEEAAKSMEFIEKNVKDQSTLQEVTVIGLSMIDDLNNLAVGRYKGRKYDEASTYFEQAYYMNSMINGGKKDTASLFNASLSAQKAKNYDRVVAINKKMVDQKLATPGTYQLMYTAKINLNDSAGASEVLKEGRQAYPNDMNLLTLETDYFLKKGKQEDALKNLNLAIEKDPDDAVLRIIIGNIYDGLANPKDKNGKDMDKPANFAELFGKAEENYKKAVDLKPGNQDYYYNALYNLGALYNNYGGYIYNKGMNDASIAKMAAKQKEINEKSNEQYKKAIPYFEQALAVKTNDATTMQALRKLYLLTGNEPKANEMGTRLKELNK